MQLTCPLCRAPLSRQDKRYCCVHGHSFDIAREGYTHLLPVQKKKSRAPGDDPHMVAARNRFLNSGHYQLFSDADNQQAKQFISPQLSTPVSIIDAGCGEGYYSTRLQQHLQAANIDHEIVGIDISKAACRVAAKRSRTIAWLVAGSSDMPVADHSADLILCLFAPIQPSEFARCLNAGGQLLIASTGPQHLFELRELLYDSVDTSSLNTHTLLQPQFAPVANSAAHIQYTIDLQDSASIQDLLSMTPHYWRASADKKSALNTIQQLSVRVDIQLNRYSLVL